MENWLRSGIRTRPVDPVRPERFSLACSGPGRVRCADVCSRRPPAEDARTADPTPRGTPERNPLLPGSGMRRDPLGLPSSVRSEGPRQRAGGRTTPVADQPDVEVGDGGPSAVSQARGSPTGPLRSEEPGPGPPRASRRGEGSPRGKRRGRGSGAGETAPGASSSGYGSSPAGPGRDGWAPRAAGTRGRARGRQGRRRARRRPHGPASCGGRSSAGGPSPASCRTPSAGPRRSG